MNESLPPVRLRDAELAVRRQCVAIESLLPERGGSGSIRIRMHSRVERGQVAACVRKFAARSIIRSRDCVHRIGKSETAFFERHSSEP